MRDTTKAQVTTLVKGLIARSEETKYKGALLALNHNSPNRIVASSWQPVLPQIAQVAGSGNSYTRIGDRVKPKGLYVDCFFAIDENEARALNLQLDIFFVQHKSKKSWNAFNAGGGVGGVELSSYLLDNGAGAKLGYDGTLEHALMPINDDLVKLVKHKRVNLYSSYTGISHEQSDCQTRRFTRMTFKIPTPSTLIYDNTIDPLNPTNFLTLMGYGFVYPDGLAPSTEIEPLQATIRSRFYYEDA